MGDRTVASIPAVVVPAFALALIVLAAPALHPGTASLRAQDVGASPTYGDVRLEEGFMPDPHTSDVTSGGGISVDVPGCAYGYVADAPDIDLYYTTSGDSDLFLWVEGDGDTTLLVNLPDGSWLCDDDSYGDTDPMLVIDSAADGLYDIWVGSYSNDNHPATLYISELDPGTGGGGPSAPDFTLDPAFGSATLAPGFTPDPHTVDLLAGGNVEVSMGGCAYGYVAEAPDFDLTWNGSGSGTLYVYAESKDDVTLLVNTPSGEWICDDDGFGGTNPIITLRAAEAGLYNIWVGSFDGERNAAAMLRITEIDPR